MIRVKDSEQTDGRYLQLFDLSLQLGHEVLLVLEFGGEAVDLHVFPARPQGKAVSHQNRTSPTFLSIPYSLHISCRLCKHTAILGPK